MTLAVFTLRHNVKYNKRSEVRAMICYTVLSAFNINNKMKRSEVVRKIIEPIVNEYNNEYKLGDFHRCSWVGGSFKWFIEILENGRWAGKTIGCYYSMKHLIELSKEKKIGVFNTESDPYFDYCW